MNSLQLLKIRESVRRKNWKGSLAVVVSLFIKSAKETQMSKTFDLSPSLSCLWMKSAQATAEAAPAF